MLVALVAAPAIPGAGSDPLLDVANAGRDGSAGHSYRPSLAPFVDIGAKLGDVNDERAVHRAGVASPSTGVSPRSTSTPARAAVSGR